MEPMSLGSRSLGSIQERRALGQALQAEPGPALEACFASWTWPPGVEDLYVKLELRLRGVAGALIVEDAVLSSTNASDADLERCILDSYRGRRLAHGGAAPGRLHRVMWGLKRFAPAR
jgi:hypothetical protein